MSLFENILNFENYKPLGINYYGSKKSIAPQLFQKMHELHFQKYGRKATHFIDCFGGGGSMTFAALQFGYKAIYNELRSDLCLLFKSLKTGDLPFEFCERDEFFKILEIPQEKRNLSEVCKNLFFSYNCNGQNYKFPNTELYQFSNNYISAKKEFDFLVKNGVNSENKLKFLKIYHTQSNFANYFNLLSARKELNLENMQIINGSFLNLKIEEFKPCEVMIYADIPYQDERSKKTYRWVYHNDFNFNKFKQWCKVLKMKDYDIFVSEYKICGDDFNEVLSIKKVVMSGGINDVKFKNKFEKLFILKELK